MLCLVYQTRNTYVCCVFLNTLLANCHLLQRRRGALLLLACAAEHSNSREPGGLQGWALFGVQFGTRVTGGGGRVHGGLLGGLHVGMIVREDEIV
jgi:hypothetical protein